MPLNLAATRAKVDPSLQRAISSEGAIASNAQMAAQAARLHFQGGAAFGQGIARGVEGASRTISAAVLEKARQERLAKSRGPQEAGQKLAEASEAMTVGEATQKGLGFDEPLDLEGAAKHHLKTLVPRGFKHTEITDQLAANVLREAAGQMGRFHPSMPQEEKAAGPYRGAGGESFPDAAKRAQAEGFAAMRRLVNTHPTFQGQIQSLTEKSMAIRAARDSGDIVAAKAMENLPAAQLPLGKAYGDRVRDGGSHFFPVDGQGKPIPGGFVGSMDDWHRRYAPGGVTMEAVDKLSGRMVMAPRMSVKKGKYTNQMPSVSQFKGEAKVIVDSKGGVGADPTEVAMELAAQQAGDGLLERIEKGVWADTPERKHLLKSIRHYLSQEGNREKVERGLARAYFNSTVPESAFGGGLYGEAAPDPIPRWISSDEGLRRAVREGVDAGLLADAYGSHFVRAEGAGGGPYRFAKGLDPAAVSQVATAFSSTLASEPVMKYFAGQFMARGGLDRIEAQRLAGALHPAGESFLKSMRTTFVDPKTGRKFADMTTARQQALLAAGSDRMIEKALGYADATRGSPTAALGPTGFSMSKAAAGQFLDGREVRGNGQEIFSGESGGTKFRVRVNNGAVSSIEVEEKGHPGTFKRTAWAEDKPTAGPYREAFEQAQYVYRDAVKDQPRHVFQQEPTRQASGIPEVDRFMGEQTANGQSVHETLARILSVDTRDQSGSWDAVVQRIVRHAQTAGISPAALEAKIAEASEAIDDPVIDGLAMGLELLRSPNKTLNAATLKALDKPAIGPKAMRQIRGEKEPDLSGGDFLRTGPAQDIQEEAQSRQAGLPGLHSDPATGEVYSTPVQRDPSRGGFLDFIGKLGSFGGDAISRMSPRMPTDKERSAFQKKEEERQRQLASTTGLFGIPAGKGR